VRITIGSIKRFDINGFRGIVPQIKYTDISIQKIHNGIHKTQVETSKKLHGSNDLFASIHRRYNKFKYAYYNKGTSRMDLRKANKCYHKVRLFLGRLRQIYRMLVSSGSPSAGRFGRQLQEAEVAVEDYKRKITKLNYAKCGRPKCNIKRNRKAVRK
jgi:hypothetical protein